MVSHTVGNSVNNSMLYFSAKTFVLFTNHPIQFNQALNMQTRPPFHANWAHYRLQLMLWFYRLLSTKRKRLELIDQELRFANCNFKAIFASFPDLYNSFFFFFINADSSDVFIHLFLCTFWYIV